MALSILAGVVLLPEYARLAEARYAHGCLEAQLSSEHALAAANERLIRALPEDDVLAVRLARSQLQWLPPNVVVAEDPGSRQIAALAPIVTVPASPRPARPNHWTIRIGGKLRAPFRRRALLLLAGLAMVTAFICFCPQRRNPANKPAASS